MLTLRVFWVSSIFAYRALFHWLNPGAYVFQKIGFPLIQMTFFALIGTFSGAQPLAFYLVGNAIVVAYRPMFTIAGAVADERRGGTLIYIVGSPANRVALFFGRASLQFVDGLSDVAFAFLYAWLIFGLDLSQTNWPGLAITVVAATFGASAVGLLLGASAYLILDAAFLANMAMFVFLLLSGANVPLAELPGWVQPIAWALPITGSVEAGRLFTTGASLAEALPLVARDVAIGVGWAIGGLVLFSWIETRARARGTLEGM